MTCTALTLTGRKCRRGVLVNDLCSVHHKQTCSICLEDVGSLNSKQSKKLTCNHSFHPDCIMNWFKESDSCPVCRVDQPEDPIIIFKKEIEDKMRIVYADAINSLERELHNVRRPRR